MKGAYINLKYYNKRIQINYYISKDTWNHMRTTGLSASFDDFEETKEKLSELVKDSTEREIIISSKLQSRLKGYTLLGLQRLKEVKKFLINQRPDITFKLAP